MIDKIDLSLFAHIQNDAYLSGTVDLEGQNFERPIDYLNQFIKENAQSIPKNYLNLVEEWGYLTQQSLKLEKLVFDGNNFDQLINQIAQDIFTLDKNKRIFLPGGWRGTLDFPGHSMVYQFQRDDKNIYFTVINSGAGLCYHEKKSTLQKELYNPIKVWSFPISEIETNHSEFLFFIKRIFKPRITTGSVDADVLYKEIFPSISFVNGKEVDPNGLISAHAYTGGQLSGTCAQRCLHQLLKINTPTLKDYQRFIFQFKHYAFLDYLNQVQVFTPEIVEQLFFAIENNLKILTIPDLFSEEEIDFYHQELLEKKALITQSQANSTKINQPLIPQEYSLTINDPNCSHLRPIFADNPHKEEKIVTNPVRANNFNLIEDLSSALDVINLIEDPATQYLYLEKLFLALPDISCLSQYNNINELKKLQTEFFQLQKIMEKLTSQWLGEIRTPSLNYMFLQLLEIQFKLNDKIQRQRNGSSFQQFPQKILSSLLIGSTTDPFFATNIPQFDQRLLEQQKSQEFKNIPTEKDYLNYLYKILISNDPTRKLDSELGKIAENYLNKKNDVTLLTLLKEHQFTALYAVSLFLNQQITLDSGKFKCILDPLIEHFAWEKNLAKNINKLINIPKDVDVIFSIKANVNKCLVVKSCLNVTEHYTRSIAIRGHKYGLAPSEPYNALIKFSSGLPVTASNLIQLAAINSENHSADNRVTITPEMIAARDFHHLRSEPSLQILLTLDYFTRNKQKLLIKTNQQYMEANLFQPGLLLTALEDEDFFSQFDLFFTTGIRFFSENGRPSKECLVYFRLDFLVSHYLSYLQPKKGYERLKIGLERLEKYLLLATEPSVIYNLKQYQFLTLIALSELETLTPELIESILEAYIYIQTHTDPNLLQDDAHRAFLERSKAAFKMILKNSDKRIVRQKSEKILHCNLTGVFPNYIISNDTSFDILDGKIFKNGLACSGVPLTIKGHPLIKELGLNNVHTCFMSYDKSYIVLENNGEEYYLFQRKENLVVQKNFTVDEETKLYELRGLTVDHLAHGSGRFIPIKQNLPAVLSDGATNYWKKVKNVNPEMLLVQGNTPRYRINKQGMQLLNVEGNTTSYSLISLKKDFTELSQFEDNNFIISYQNEKNTFFELSRYDLKFKKENQSDKLILDCTQEFLIPRPQTLPASIGGICLSDDNNNQRLLIPISRFYELPQVEEKSNYYRFYHDTQGLIAKNTLARFWERNPPAKKPLWHHQNSENYESYQLNQDGELIAATVEGQLYLAYLYLGANKTKKAWHLLDECLSRFGSLNGSMKELQYLMWIVESLPYVHHKKDATRNTPPYVACKLKALSLLTDYLYRDQTFNFQAELEVVETANQQYFSLQQQAMQQFLRQLPATIYWLYSRYQSMGRHQKIGYKLSRDESICLLNHYHQENDALGALGYSWSELNLAALLDESHLLKASRETTQLTAADNRRLHEIEEHIRKIKPIKARSSALTRKAIDLTLPINTTVNRVTINDVTKFLLERWLWFIEKTPKNPNECVKLLTSEITDDEFIQNFPTYLTLAQSAQKDSDDYKRLSFFCEKKLIASRHVPLGKQSSNIPMFCNLLYRVMNIPGAAEIIKKLPRDAHLTQLILTINQDSTNIPPLAHESPHFYIAKKTFSQIF